MKFLGGFLKFLSILLMLIGAAVCAIFCFQGVELEDPSLYWAGGIIFLCILIVALCIWGTGSALMQIAKLKKRVTHLEQRLWNAPLVEPAATAASGTVVKPAFEENAPAEVPAEVPAPTAKPQKKWLPVAIGSASVAVVLLVVLIVVIAGGRNNDTNVEAPIPPDTGAIEMPPIDMEEPEDTEAPETPTKPEAEELSMGSVLSTDFVEINFNEIIVERDIQKAVTIDNVTRITGPDPIDGQKYICLSGTIVNTSTAPLPVYDFFIGRFEIDGYTYEVTANNCDILSANGDPESTIDPLMEYEIRIYTAIPDALAESYSTSSFTFGFYDGFDNKDLSYNKAFADDPVAECPYQYFIPFQ